MLNKNTKLFLLFSLVLITLVGITTVSAVDVDNNATTTIEDATSNTDVSQANVNTLNDNNKNVYKSDVQDTSTVKDTDKAKSVSTKTVEQTNTKQVKGDEPTVTLTVDPVQNTYLPGQEVTVTATLDSDVEAIDTTFFIEDEDDYYSELDGDVTYNDNIASIITILPAIEGMYTLSVDTNDGLTDSIQINVKEESEEDEKQATNLFVEADDTDLDNDLIIWGSLTDENDEGIPGATIKITVTYDDTEVSFTTLTDEEGLFEDARRPLHTGEVTVTAVYDGDDTYYGYESEDTAVITDVDTVYTPIIDWEPDDFYNVTEDIIVSGDVYYIDDNGRVAIDNLKMYVTITYSDDSTFEADVVKSDEGTFKAVIPASENVLGEVTITITTDENNPIYESVSREYETLITEEFEYETQISLEIDDNPVILKDFTITGWLSYVNEEDITTDLPNQDITLKVIYDDDILNPTTQEFTVTSDDNGEFSQTVTPLKVGNIAIVANYDKNESYAAANRTINTEINRVTPKVNWEELDDTYDITDDIEVAAYISYDGEAITTENITVPTVTIVYSDGSTSQASDVTLDEEGFLHATFEAPHNADGAIDVYMTIESTDVIEETTSYYDGESEITIKDQPTITVDLLDNYVYNDDILISGNVYDSEDNPIEDMEVTLTITYNDDDENAITVTLNDLTDDNGYYEYTITGAEHTGKMTVYATTTEDEMYYQAEETAETKILKETYLDVDVDSTTVVENFLIHGSLMYTDETVTNEPLGGKTVKVTLTYDETGEEVVYDAITDDTGSYSVSELPLTSGDISVVATFTDENVEYADYVATNDGIITKADLNILGEADEEWYTDEDLIVTAWITYDVDGEEYEITSDDASYYTVTMTIEGDNKLYEAEDVVIEDGLLSATFKAPFTTGTGTVTITRDETDLFNEASNRDELTVEFIEKSEATVTISADDTYYADDITVTGTLFNTTDIDNPVAIEDATITIDVILNDEVIDTVITTTDSEGSYTIDIPTTVDMIGEEITLVAKFEDPDYVSDDEAAIINVLAKETNIDIEVDATDILTPITIYGNLMAEDSTGEVYLADKIITLTVTYNDDDETTETIKVLTDENGEYQTIITPKTTGTIQVTATYAGDDDYSATESENEGTISKVEPFIYLESEDTWYTEDDLTITALVSYQQGDEITYITNDDPSLYTITMTIEGDNTIYQATNIAFEGDTLTATFNAPFTTGIGTITVTRAATDIFKETADTAEVEFITKPVAKITIEAEDTYYADDIIATGTLFDITDEENPVAIEGATVTIEVYLNDELINTLEAEVDENGDYTINIPTTADMIDEEITLVAKYEDEDYKYTEDEALINVLNKETTVTVDVESVTILDPVTITGVLFAEDATGEIYLPDQIITLTITYNDDEETTETIKVLTDENGEYQTTITPKTTGTIQVTATYAGDDDYTEATAENEGIISKVDVYIDFESDDTYYDEDSIIITAPIYYLDADDNEVPLTNDNITDITVTITYSDGTQAQGEDVTIEDGEITAKIPAIHPTGDATITITTQATDKFEENTVSDTTNILFKSVAEITIEAEDTYYADDIIVTGTLFNVTDGENPVAIEGATVTIEVYLNDELINTLEAEVDENGDYTINIPTTADMIDEEITLVAKYEDEDYSCIPDDATVKVLSKETNLNVIVESGRIVDPITITGLLQGIDATGDVDLADQIITLTITYNNDDETTFTQKVLTDENGEFQITITPKTTGTIQVTATYAGSNDYPAAEAEDEGTITKADVIIDFETEEWAYSDEDIIITAPIYYLDADDNEVPLTNDNITDLTVTVTYGDGSEVTITDATIENGEITATIPAEHPTGIAAITITTTENDKFTQATTNANIEIRAKNNATITIEAEDTYYADEIIITGTLSNITDEENPVAITDATVTIDVILNDEVINTVTTTTDEEGTYNISIPTTEEMIGEEITLIAKYEDSDYAPVENDTTINVLNKETRLIVQVDSTRILDPVTISGYLSAEDQTGDIDLADQIVKLTVTYNDDADTTQTYRVVTEDDGTFEKIITPTQTGTIKVIADYEGTTDYPEATDEDEGNINKVEVFIDFEYDDTLYTYEDLTVNGLIYYLDANGNEVPITSNNVTPGLIELRYDEEPWGESYPGTIDNGEIYGTIPAWHVLPYDKNGNATISISSEENDIFLAGYASSRVEVIERKEAEITVQANNTILPAPDIIDDGYYEDIHNTTTVTGKLTLPDDSRYPVEVIIDVIHDDEFVDRKVAWTDENGEYSCDIDVYDDMLGEVTIIAYYEDDDYTATNNTTFIVSQRSNAVISFNFTQEEYNETDNITINGIVKDYVLEEGIEGAEVTVTIHYDWDEAITVEGIVTDSEGKFNYTFTAEKPGIVYVTTTSLESDEYGEATSEEGSATIKELPKTTVIIMRVYDQNNYGKDIYITNGSKEYFTEDISIAVNGNITAKGELLPTFVDTINVVYTIDYEDESLTDTVINNTEDIITWDDGTNYNSIVTLEDNANVSVQVFYYGLDDVYLPSSSDIVTFEVIKENLTINLTVDPDEIELGESSNITAAYLSSITGEVIPDNISIIIMNSNGTIVAQTNAQSGNITYTFTPDKLDIYTVFGGDDFIGFKNATISVGGKYDRISNIDVEIYEPVYYQNRSESISGSLYYGDEEIPIGNQNVTLTFTYEDGLVENYTAITNSHGLFVVEINPQGFGKANITASFVGNETDTEIFEAATSEEYPTEVIIVEYDLNITQINGTDVQEAPLDYDLGSEVEISGKVTTNYVQLDVSEVTVVINNDTENAETIPLDDEGNFEYTFDGKDAGEYNITVKLNDEVLDSVTIVIDNEIVEVIAELDDDELYLGEEATITGQLVIAGTTTPVANEEIIIKVNGEEKTRVTTDEAGLFDYSFTPDATGEYTVEVIHEATNNYDADSTTLTLNVIEKVNTTVSIETDKATALTPVNITGKLTDSEGNAIAGENVTVTINGANYIVTTGEDGNYTVEYTPANTDDINVSVDYAGNEKYNPSTQNATITVESKDIIMTVQPESITGKVDDEIAVKVSFNDENINSGVVTLTDKDGNILAVMDVEDGKANATIVFDEAYEGDIIASYRGDKNYDVADVTVPADIDALNATITIDPIADANVGDNVTVTGKVLDENGKPVANTPVTVNDQAVITDEAGNFEAVVIPTTEGVQNVTVTLPESDRYTEATKNATYTASKKDATITADVPEDAEVGKETTVNGTVTDSEGNPVAGVPVTVTVNDVPTTVTTDEDGKYTVPFTPTTAGPQNVNVAIDDDTYKADPVTDSFDADKQTATITPDEIKEPEVGKETTISGIVTDEEGNPVAGIPVTVTVNGEPTTVITDGNGKYEVPFTPTNTDENNVTVSIDNDTYEAEPVKDSFTADKQTATITQDPIENPEVGKETPITGKVTDEDGNPVAGVPVTVTINGKPTTVTTDEDGKYTVPFTPTTAGPQNVNVAIDDDTYKAEPVTDSFDADKQAATIKVDDVDSEVDVPTNITGTVTDSEGKPVADTPVTVTIDGKPTTVTTDKDGKFTVPYTPTKAGEHELEASIDDDTYKADPVEDTFETAKHDATITVDSVKDPKLGLETEITGTVTDSEGKPLANTPVTVTVNGKATNVTTDKDGKYSLPITPTSVGTNNVTVALPENDKYEAKPASTTFDADKQDYKVSIDPVNNPVAGKSTDITGTVTDEEGKPVAGVPVTVNVNGKATKVTTDKDGKFNVSATPTEGTNTITASIPETANSYGQSVNQTITITKIPTKLTLNVNDSVKVGDTITITGSLKDNANKVLAGATVTVNVDSTSYTMTTDNKGNFNRTAKVTEVGKTTVTASYAGNATYEAASAVTKVVKVNKLNTNTTVANVTNKTRTNITVTATVKDENNKNVNGGVVIFTDSSKTQLGTANVTGGKASVVVSYNTTFNGTVTASYTGSDNYTASTGSNNITINKLNTSLTIDPISGKVFDVIPVTVHVVDENGNPVVSGKVIFKVNGLTSQDENGETLRAVVVNGTAVANITTTKTWLNITSFVAKYIGDNTYEQCNNTTDDINISKRVANIELASDRTVARGGDQVVFTAIVTDEGKAVNGGVVIFKINGQTIKDASGNAIKVEVVNGTAKLTYDVPLGMSAKNLTITAVYSNNVYDRAENTSALNIIRMDVYFNTSIVRTSTSTAHVSATLHDAYGNLCTETTSVALKCGGRTLAHVDVKGGILEADIDVTGYKVGTHTLEYVAGLNNRYNSVRMTNALVIEKAA